METANIINLIVIVTTDEKKERRTKSSYDENHDDGDGQFFYILSPLKATARGKEIHDMPIIGNYYHH